MKNSKNAVRHRYSLGTLKNKITGEIIELKI